MKKCKNKIIEFKFAIITLTIVVIIGLIIILLLNHGNKISLVDFTNESFAVKHNSSWNIVSKSTEKIEFKHSSNSYFKIEILNLTDDSNYKSLDELYSDTLQNLVNMNTEYTVIGKEYTTVTNKSLEGYKVLLQKDDHQVLSVFVKDSEKLILFTYEADNSYFDILLDSVQSMIYNFSLNDIRYDFESEIKIDTTSISYETEKEVTDLLSNTKEVELAYNNFYVKYTVPENFDTDIVSSSGVINYFEGLTNGSINIYATIYNRNIYEYLDTEEIFNMYSKYNTYKTSDDYSDFEENISEIDSELQAYVYKNSYNNENSVTGNIEKSENVVLLYSLDKNHVLSIEISSSKISIPKELVDMINIEEYFKYSSYTPYVEDGENTISEFIHDVDNERTELKLTLPDKYKQLDKNQNIYEQKYFGLNWNEDLQIFDYDIKYTVHSPYLSKESLIDLTNSSIDFYKPGLTISSEGDKEYNGKTFSTYTANYQRISNLGYKNETYSTNLIVLYYSMPDGRLLEIKIEGNNNTITNDMILELTNFKIEKKEG